MFHAFNSRVSTGSIASHPGALVASVCSSGRVTAIVSLKIGENIHLLLDA